MGSTIVHVFLEKVNRRASQVALRRRGAYGWEEISWRAYGAQVDAVGFALLASGVQAGDRVGIMSANRPEWLFADIGIMGMGGVSVPIYPTVVADAAEHVAHHSEMKVLFVGDAAQSAKIASIRANLPKLEHVVTFDSKPAEGEITFEAFLERGRAYRASHSGELERARLAVRADNLATIVYTSGTTGNPKGVMLSHRNLVFEASAMVHLVSLPSGLDMLSFLPLSHVAERLQGELVSIFAGCVVNFARSMETIKEDMVEIRPHVLTCVPRLWEKIHEGILAQVAQAPKARQRLFKWALDVGITKFKGEREGRVFGKRFLAQALLADQLVASKIRRRLGLDRVMFLISGAAPLAPHISEFFGALGLPIQEGYGLSETTGASHIAPSREAIRVGSVGTPLGGVDCRIAEDGEILLRGDNVFMGYFKDQAATEEVLVNGWLHTGDIGRIDVEGNLRITDRKKDIIVTAGGKNVAPQNIENRIKAQPGISQVVVLGDRRRYLVALVTIDQGAMTRVLGQAPKGKMSTNKEVRDYVQRVIEETNKTLSSYETVKRFEILDDDFTIEGGELTPSMKVKRRVIDERYRSLIDQLYEAA